MKERQQELLRKLIEQYLKTAQPVASSLLVDLVSKKVSSATLRNEMAELEKQGYVFQPHTSAGRAPSIKGYQFYVDNFLIIEITQEYIDPELEFIKEKDNLKKLARKLAELSQETVILGFAEDDFYYTGLANLFAKPEFESKDLVINLSSIIDNLDQVMLKLFKDIEKIEILIGEDNPFGQNCSAIVGKFKFKGQEMLVVLLGPTRMDYQKNYFLIKKFIEKVYENQKKK